MPTITRRSEDPFRKYWWVVLLVVLAVGGGSLYTLQNGGTAADGAVDTAAGESSEQSLHSLDAVANPNGAPGQAISLSMEGSYRRRGEDASTQSGSLYQSPQGMGASGAPIGAEGVASADGSAVGGGTLAEALKNVGKARPDKTDNKGWGDAAVRTGLSAGGRKLGALSGLGGTSGGTSGATMAAAPTVTAFGTGRSDPGSAPTVGGAGSGGAGRFNRGTNQTLNALRGVETLTSKAAVSGNSDLAVRFNARGFDAASAAAPSLPRAGGAALGIGGVTGQLDGVPENLKLSDPKLQRKELKPPEIKKEEEAKDPKLEMEKAMMTMLVQAVVGGLLGPVFGGMGGALASGMGLPPSTSGTTTGSSIRTQ